MSFLEKVKDNLVDDFRDAWKFASVWIIAAIGVLDLLYEHMPFVQQYMPSGTVTVLAGMALVARLYRQKHFEKRE
ncbi:MAG TPA: hypothetical protein VKY62_04075 [Devosia sp.]|nr:hypothetical protein [Devosia sp.]